MDGIELLIAGLAVWRLSRLITEDVVSDWLRTRFAATPYMGFLVSCVYCVSTWVAIPIALWLEWSDPAGIVVAWMAIAGMAALIASTETFLVER